MENMPSWRVSMSKLDQTRAPILEALEEMKTARLVPFDVPGHKRGKGNPDLEVVKSKGWML